MYKNSFQYGKQVQLFNIQNKETLNNWSFNGPTKKAYDKSCKGFVLITEHNTRACIPQDPRNQELYLVQPFLLLQLMILDKKVFHMEVAVTDQNKVKRRLNFSAAQAYSCQKDNIIKQPLHARIPCEFIVDGIWLNLQFDIQSFMERCFGEVNFRSIDSIIITGAYKMRKVMTMKQQIQDTISIWIDRELGEEVAVDYEQNCGESSFNIEDIPSNLNFQPGVEFLNQVISYDRIVYWGYITDQIRVGSGGGSPNQKARGPRPDIAFGTRITTKGVIDQRRQLESALSPTKSQSPKKYQFPDQSRIPNIALNNKVVQEYQSPSKRRQLHQYRSEDDVYVQEQNQFMTPQVRTRLSGLKANLPKNLHQEVIPEDIDFSQYSLPKSSVKKQSSKISQGTATSKYSPNFRQTHMIDENYLNARIKQIEQTRIRIHDLANKYGLENNVKVQKFSLLTCFNPNLGGYNFNGSEHSKSIISTDPKERVREYHEKVNRMRKRIHQRTLSKKKEKRETETQVAEFQVEEQGVAKQHTLDKETKQQEPTTLRVSVIRQDDNLDGWEGQEVKEEFNEDEVNEDQEDNHNEEDEDAKQGDEDYGQEEDYGKEEGEKEEDYGEEDGQNEGEAEQEEEEAGEEDEEAEEEY